MGNVVTTQVARSEPFDNSTNGFSSTNSQDAIEEARQDAVDTIRIPHILAYNGTAGSGKWLERFASISSNDGPIVLPETRVMVLATLTAQGNATGTVTIYKDPRGTPISIGTISLSNSKSTHEDFSVELPIGTEVAAKVTSGSFSSPVVEIEFFQVL